MSGTWSISLLTHFKYYYLSPSHHFPCNFGFQVLGIEILNWNSNQSSQLFDFKNLFSKLRVKYQKRNHLYLFISNHFDFVFGWRGSCVSEKLTITVKLISFILFLHNLALNRNPVWTESTTQHQIILWWLKL